MTINSLANTDENVVRVFIIRHGQTDHNIQKILQGHLDIDINQAGLEQAKLVADRLKDLPFDKVVTSDLVRCRNTLNEILVHQMEIPVKVTSDLREREMGVVQGMYLKDAIKLGEKHGKHFKEFGESLDSLMTRVLRQWDSIIEESVAKSYKNYGFCTHGGVITAFVNYLHSGLNYELNPKLSRGDLKVPYNTSITVIDINKKDRTGLIQIFGDTEHLGAQLEVKNQLLR